ncbi:hypothetical protein H2200_005071 [Cladophialophora chaetospira]|uniref:Zn(2)-C6 fungal-type domain-containing protein n=1 Tax=Cladophialophora chaetospira TaxID=386627 RepID=A0AA38XBX7_9EURO|nr:hypothetical protein H2200_005071 [Cladophialophora chaetospira]
MKQAHRPPRRQRIPLSCEACRTRKLRCDRNKPCQNCASRNEHAICVYRGSRPEPTFKVHVIGDEDPVRQRIDQLEALVKRLRNQHHIVANGAGPSQDPKSKAAVLQYALSEPPDVMHSTGTTRIDGGHSVYQTTDHWYEVLQEINDLKKAWSQSQDDQHDYAVNLSNTADGTSLLFGHVKEIGTEDILATLPLKPVVDKLVREFFDRKAFPLSIVPILHEPTFMREYIQYWADPNRTSIIWTGLLFSILGIVMLAYQQFGEPPEYEGISESLLHLYRLRTAQCLIIGDIAKGLPYTLEALRLNATAELNRKEDNSRGLWIMTGVIVRVAINMGYHRDPSQSSPISMLQAEYRRRVWLAVIGVDDMASFLLGFPRMISAISRDTSEPRNLHDSDLPDEIATLPPSRPLTEATPITYMIVKGRLFRVLGRITDLNNTLSPGTYDTILEIDNSLQEAYHSIPSHMKVDGSKKDPSPLRNPSDLSNFMLECMYHYGMLKLHRKYVAKGRLDPRYNLSRDRCISSAATLLDHQDLLDAVWYKSAQTRQILSLAALMLLLELEHRRRDLEGDIFSDSDALLQALEKSVARWEAAKTSCDEAGRLHRILASMVARFQIGGSTTLSETRTPQALSGEPAFDQSSQQIDNDVSDPDAFTMPNDMDIDWVSLSNSVKPLFIYFSTGYLGCIFQRRQF